MASQGYAGVPAGPLSAYLGVREANRGAGLEELQGAGQMQGLLAKMQAQQELQQIKQTVAQAGGDPAKASEALIKLGSPQALKLGIEMKSLLPKPAEPFNLPAGSKRFGTTGALIAENPKELTAPTTRSRISGETIIQEEFDRTTGKWSEIGKGPRFSKQVEIALPEEAKLTGDALEQAAFRYRIDGTLPPNLGRGTQGAVNTTAILSRAAELANEAGDTAEGVRIRQISGRANSGALLQLEKQRNLIVAFKNTASRNADLVLEQSEKTDRLGSPALDRWILSGKKNIAGDPEVAKLDLAMRTFINEYARVTTTVTGGGITSDTARREIEELVRSALTKEQVRQVIAFAKREMDNREKSYIQQAEDIKKRLSVTPAPIAPTPAPAAAPPASQGQWKVVR